MCVGAATTENSMVVPQKLKIKLPCDPAIPLQGMYLDKTVIQKDTCHPYVRSGPVHNRQDMDAT